MARSSDDEAAGPPDRQRIRTATAAIVPAAGRAARFGGAKLLVDLGGEPLLAHTLRSLLAAGLDRVVVVAPAAAAFDAVPLVADARVGVAANPDPSRGMFSSIQTGLAAVDAGTLVILPADMPFVRPETVRAVVEAAGTSGGAVVPIHDGRKGHPIALPGELRAPLLAASATTNLKQALIDLGAVWTRLPVEDPGVLRDVDVPADL